MLHIIIDCGYYMWHIVIEIEMIFITEEQGPMAKTMKWTRRFPNSANNFDLVLTGPQELDFGRMRVLLNVISGETYRGLTLSSRATKELRRWFDQPDTP